MTSQKEYLNQLLAKTCLDNLAPIYSVKDKMPQLELCVLSTMVMNEM